jgi:hypothetical protein
MSVLTLNAKPWLVIQREMRTPMAPILAAWSVDARSQAPVMPCMRPASRP